MTFRQDSERDPELDELFHEPELHDMAQLLRSVAHERVDPDPAFRTSLRRRLMAEAWDQMQPRAPWYRRIWAPSAPRRPLFSGPMLAGLAGAIGVCLLAFAMLNVILTQPGKTTTVTASSPLQDAQAVGLKEPIVINFNHPVDPHEVQVQIEPATQAKYDWQGSSVKITPVNNLAPNTQYRVTVAPAANAAKTANQAVERKKVTFVTTTPPPTPTPTPTTRPTPTGTPQPVSNVRQLASTGTPAARWSGDGSKLYVVGPAGQLTAVPVAGGEAQQLQPNGVSLVAPGPNGPAYVRGGLVVYGQVAVPGLQPIALGFRGGNLAIATAESVVNQDTSKVASFSEAATAAEFSLDGGRIAYLGASGLHVVDLTTQADKLVGPAAGLGDWSPDGRRYAYPTESTVSVTDGATTKALASVPGVSGVSWSRATDLLLLGGSSSLQVLSADGSDGPRKVADGAYSQPSWSPAGSTFAFQRGGAVWAAQLSLNRPTATQSVDDAVNAFMTARKANAGDQASSYLDAAGKAAFANLKLVYPDSPQLSRYYVIFSQGNQAVVRLVLKEDGVETTLVDETLALVTDPSTGRVLVHGVTEAPGRPVGKGPEVLKVSVQGNQVRVAFDSDLEPTTTAAGVTLKGASVTSSYDSASRTVILTAPGGLTAGTDYKLSVIPNLKDVNQHPAAPFLIDFGTA
jgi:hypothetical protein